MLVFPAMKAVSMTMLGYKVNVKSVYFPAWLFMHVLPAAVYGCVYNSVVHMFTRVHYSYLHRNVDAHTIVVVILRIVIIGRLLSVCGSWGILISVKIVSITNGLVVYPL